MPEDKSHNEVLGKFAASSDPFRAAMERGEIRKPVDVDGARRALRVPFFVFLVLAVLLLVLTLYHYLAVVLAYLLPAFAAAAFVSIVGMVAITQVGRMMAKKKRKTYAPWLSAWLVVVLMSSVICWLVSALFPDGGWRIVFYLGSTVNLWNALVVFQIGAMAVYVPEPAETD